MKRYNTQKQLSIAEFAMPFEAKLDENNRWVVLSGVIPWDKFAELYYKNFPSRRGAPTKDARMVLGVVIIKHMLKLDDIGIIEIIQENPYMQYFLGLKGFMQKPVFDPSLLVYIRKRIDLSVFESLTEELICKGLKIKSTPVKETKDDNDDVSTPVVGSKNKGKLQLDATVADAHIKFPTDLDLLSDSRMKAEDLIDHLCKELVQVDKIYLNRSNRAWLKERNIRHTGDPLGRKPVKTVKSYYMRRKERREAAERNQIEGKFGQGKNGYNLNQIRAKLSSTSMSWIAAIIFVMNVIRYTRDFPGSILKWLFANVMKMREEIILTFMPAQRNLGLI